ncbi:MAG TPA: endonuclease/exonuclease/phosphatase family protein [Candidatus Nanopelagicales bacterium]|nr:endonuclease/exonuclease/phosphatase family protein [Candidatus Nanopelagicales bacterium]
MSGTARTWLRRCGIAGVAAALALAGLAPAGAARPQPVIPVDAVRVVTFNVLAPPWTDPSYYPAAAAPLLDRATRRAHIVAWLQSQAATTDVFSLQETTPVEMGYVAAALPGFTPFQANHTPEHWSNWITPAAPWEPNGVALLVKRSRFDALSFADIALTTDGDHAAMLTATSTTTGRTVRVISAHLDSDHAGNRDRELNAALAFLPPGTGSLDLLTGDLNTDTDTGNFHTALAKAGFVDVLDAVGTSTWTSPYTEKYYGNGQWGDIDHVLVRGARPTSGRVEDFGQLTTIADQDARIVANLRTSGSDHYPVVAAVTG